MVHDLPHGRICESVSFFIQQGPWGQGSHEKKSNLTDTVAGGWYLSDLCSKNHLATSGLSPAPRHHLYSVTVALVSS